MSSLQDSLLCCLLYGQSVAHIPSRSFLAHSPTLGPQRTPSADGLQLRTHPLSTDSLWSTSHPVCSAQVEGVLFCKQTAHMFYTQNFKHSLIVQYYTILYLYLTILYCRQDAQADQVATNKWQMTGWQCVLKGGSFASGQFEGGQLAGGFSAMGDTTQQLAKDAHDHAAVLSTTLEAPLKVGSPHYLMTRIELRQCSLTPPALSRNV